MNFQKLIFSLTVSTLSMAGFAQGKALTAAETKAVEATAKRENALVACYGIFNEMLTLTTANALRKEFQDSAIEMTPWNRKALRSGFSGLSDSSYKKATPEILSLAAVAAKPLLMKQVELGKSNGAYTKETLANYSEGDFYFKVALDTFKANNCTRFKTP